jgi:tetratricopeptide (TPR) repeat protein
MITEKLGPSGEIPPVIIVGVANTNRYRDLLPVKSGSSGEGGGADNFLRFIEEELIPHIDNTYRTKNFRMLAGPQAAAIFSLYSLITKPGLFQGMVTDNPFRNPKNAEFLYPRAETFFKDRESLPGFLYIRCEKNEQADALKYAHDLAALLENHRPTGFRSIVEFTDPSGYFIPPLPFGAFLRSLFDTYQPPGDFQVNSIDDILQYYRQLSRDYGFEVDPPDRLLTTRGIQLWRSGNIAGAIGVFKHQLKLNPGSLNALWQLGELYRAAGKYSNARECYLKFLDIRDTDVSMIKRRLEQVERIIASSAAYRIEQEIEKNGLEAGLTMYRDIRSGPETELYFDQGEFNALGYRLLGSGQVKAALEIFKAIVEMYPESANAHDSLAEGYLRSGDKELAIRHYRKSLELNPENSNAAEQLKRLEKQ